jgi:hypothetical protein
MSRQLAEDTDIDADDPANSIEMPDLRDAFHSASQFAALILTDMVALH